MPDKEKVIKGLEVCFDSSKECNGCPYIATPYCKTTLRNDVTALLKEQEHKDRMFHALEDDWKRLNKLLKEQQERIETLESLRRIEQGGGLG